MSKKTKNTNNTYTKKISFVPVILMLAVVPLILRWHVTQLDGPIARFWIGTYETNLYTYAKSIAIIILTIIMATFSFLTIKKETIKKDKTLKLVLIGSCVFIGFSIFSTILSDHKDIAIWGAPERREGLVLHLCYILMFLYTYLVYQDKEDFRYIKYPLIFLSVVMGLIGLSQILGKDILNMDFMNDIMMPNEYKDVFTPQNTGGSVYLTLMHSNYVGSYASIIMSFFAVLTLSNHESTPMRIIYGAIFVFTGIILIKANSQAGIVGVGVSMLALFIIYSKKIFKSKKLVTALLLFVLATVSITNIVTKGLLLDNTIDIFVDAKKVLVKDPNHKYDPTYGLPVYDVKASKSLATIYTKDGELNIYFKNATDLQFTDSNKKPVEAIYNKDQKNYKFAPPFQKLMLLESSESSQEFSQIAVYYEDFTYYIIEYTKEEGAYLIDSQGYRYENMIAPHMGFESSERAGSMRGYIWSRTLPLIAKNPIFGYGPDNFLVCFPQYDIAAKTYAYETPFMIVDKPHNIYILYAINSGIIALLSVVFIWLMYIVDSCKLYGLKKEYSQGDYYALACSLAIIGYLAAGFFNDSVPTVAPIFWILLGAGYATNHINKKMKTRKTS